MLPVGDSVDGGWEGKEGESGLVSPRTTNPQGHLSTCWMTLAHHCSLPLPPTLTAGGGQKSGPWVWESSTAAEAHRQLCCPAMPWTAVPPAVPEATGQGALLL